MAGNQHKLANQMANFLQKMAGEIPVGTKMASAKRAENAYESLMRMAADLRSGHSLLHAVKRAYPSQSATKRAALAMALTRRFVSATKSSK